MREVDARLALIRNAIGPPPEPARVSPLQRRKSQAVRMAAWVESECPITDELREEYQFEFDERVSIKVYSGAHESCGSKASGSDCCATHSTLDELGCVEFWVFMRLRPFVRGMVRVRVPVPVGHCSRCESVGHAVERCPFGVGDAGGRELARQRRERRARRAA